MAKQNKGSCQFCGKILSKSGLSKHLNSCQERQQAIANAEQPAGKAQNFYHLVVQDAYSKDFFLHLEMRGNAKLSDLDHYLREIWLECCGHLSEFSLKKVHFGWGNASENGLSMKQKVDDLFELDMVLEHIYDFGSPSVTLVKVQAVRKGQPLTKNPIVLMARNQMPEETCMECEQVAHWYCAECLIEHEQTGLLCNKHVKNHPHDEYGEPIELVNSPRMGICGYAGPADPPY